MAPTMPRGQLEPGPTRRLSHVSSHECALYVAPSRIREDIKLKALLPTAGLPPPAPPESGRRSAAGARSESALHRGAAAGTGT